MYSASLAAVPPDDRPLARLRSPRAQVWAVEFCQILWAIAERGEPLRSSSLRSRPRCCSRRSTRRRQKRARHRARRRAQQQVHPTQSPRSALAPASVRPERWAGRRSCACATVVASRRPVFGSRSWQPAPRALADSPWPRYRGAGSSAAARRQTEPPPYQRCSLRGLQSRSAARRPRARCGRTSASRPSRPANRDRPRLCAPSRSASCQSPHQFAALEPCARCARHPGAGCHRRWPTACACSCDSPVDALGCTSGWTSIFAH